MFSQPLKDVVQAEEVALRQALSQFASTSVELFSPIHQNHTLKSNINHININHDTNSHEKSYEEKPVISQSNGNEKATKDISHIIDVRDHSGDKMKNEVKNERKSDKNRGSNKNKKQKTPKPTFSPLKGLDEYVSLAINPPEEKYIRVIPGIKIPIKLDRRVVMTDIQFPKLERLPGEPSGIPGNPKALIQTQSALKRHPVFELLSSKHDVSLEDTMIYIQNQVMCTGRPIFMTMATVGDELYWQLIENFMYTLVKFNLSDCSLVICVTDPTCMKLCADSSFPCFDWKYESAVLPSVMEQIASVKLLHIPKAMAKGVSVFMLDLDVGFLADPMQMVNAFMETPKVDIFVQEDLLFIMNRTKAGW